MATEPRWSDYDWLLESSLREDRADEDVTTRALVPGDLRADGHIIARQDGVVCGLPLAERLATWVDSSLEVQECVPDGVNADEGDTVAVVRGHARSILTVERTMLNFLQRLGGTATLASRYVSAVEGTDARILDTRKTTPGWRELEKYAVRCGGGHNHRMNLAQMALIKDNHLAIRGATPEDPEGVAAAVRAVREAHPDVPVEVEVDTLAQLEAALPARPDLVLLDNMTPGQVRQAVVLVDRQCADGPRPELEASGGITLANVRAYAHAGAERIAIGALTHSAPALDLGLDMEL
jgi:nicotinate-nucleotide pyrophosphorylase (carboxylating)